jgi:predicted nucleotidyltransferase
MPLRPLTREYILQQLKAHKSILNQFGVVQIGLFGSFVRKEQKNSSDIDFLVEFQPEMKTFRNYMGLKFALEALFHKKIDLVIKSALKPAIRDEILSSVMYASND